VARLEHKDLWALRIVLEANFLFGIFLGRQFNFIDFMDHYLSDLHFGLLILLAEILLSEESGRYLVAFDAPIHLDRRLLRDVPVLVPTHAPHRPPSFLLWRLRVLYQLQRLILRDLTFVGLLLERLALQLELRLSLEHFPFFRFLLFIGEVGSRGSIL